MATNDKTRQKLVDTMRRTKVGASKKATPKTKAQPKQEASKPAPAAKPKPAVQKKQQARPAITSSPVSGDAYQSTRRVWPD